MIPKNIKYEENNAFISFDNSVAANTKNIQLDITI